MTIVTRKRSENYAIIPNHVADDTRLSFEARGVLVYLLAKPHDWKILIGDLRKQGLGRDRAYRILAELQKAGYIERSQQRGTGGRHGEIEYTVYDDPVPVTLPLPEKPEAVKRRPEKQEAARPNPEKPHPGKPDTENPDALIRTESTNPPLPPSPLPLGPDPLGFGQLLRNLSPQRRTADLALARRMFENLPAQVERDNAIACWPLYERIRILRGNLRGKGGPNLVTYLKERAWRDLVDAPPVDRDGDFVITPDREEWPAWLDAVRATHGEVGVASARRTGRILRKDRWPPVCATQMAMALSPERVSHGAI